MRTRCRVATIAIAATALLAAARVAPAQISDGDATWSWGSPGSTDFRADVDGPDQLHRNWWWWRVDGDPHETAFADVLSDGVFAGDTAVLTWQEAVFKAELVTVIADGTVLEAATCTQSLTVINTGPSELTIYLFCYLDADVDGADGDEAAEVAPNAMVIVDDATLHRVAFKGVAAADYQVEANPAVVSALDDDAVTNFASTGLPFGPGDYAGAYQWRLTVEPDASATVHAVFTLGGGPPCAVGVSDLTCDVDCVTGDLLLTWVNGDPYDEIVVTIDGVPVSLQGTATSYVTTLGDGPHSVEVAGYCGGVFSPVASCGVTILAGGLPDHIVYAAEEASLVDSVSALAAALDGLGESYLVVDDILDLPCGGALTAGQTIWSMCGTFPDKHILTVDEGAFYRDHAIAGGHVYHESGDSWGFDSPTPFADIDGVLTASDGDDTLFTLTGLDHAAAILSDMSASYTQDQAGNDWNDQLWATAGDTLGPNAGVIWQGPGYNVGIYYDTEPGYGRVISSSWEFGGYGGDQTELARRYVIAFVGETEFRRGDANGDGVFDIADPTFLLSALFIPGPDPPCEDAADANDDGSVDVGDPVTALFALFVPESPPLPAPGSSGCGVDPSVDAIGCESSDACP